jgi:hypothetical protein
VRVSFEAPQPFPSGTLSRANFFGGLPDQYSASDEKIDELDQYVKIRVNNRAGVGGIGDNSVVLVRTFEYTPML